MSGKDKKKGDYPVGYGKPPKSGQFKPGQSGNPSGKKKGKSLAQYIAEAGEEERTFKLNGKMVTMPLNAVVAQRLYADAANGKHQVSKVILDSGKSLSGDMQPGQGILLGPEEVQVAQTHADWLKLIEDVTGGHCDDDAAE